MRSLDAAVERDPAVRRTAIVLGLVFLIASVPKLVFFDFELDQFERFGLPFPSALVIVAGVVELAGGIALMRRRFLAPALMLLVPTMLVAFVSSGLLQGDIVPSLTVAPALLAGMVWLVVRASAAEPPLP